MGTSGPLLGTQCHAYVCRFRSRVLHSSLSGMNVPDTTHAASNGDATFVQQLRRAQTVKEWMNLEQRCALHECAFSPLMEAWLRSAPRCWRSVSCPWGLDEIQFVRRHIAGTAD